MITNEINIIDYNKRSKRAYSLQTHNKASLPIKTSKSLVKIVDTRKKKINKSSHPIAG